ncbi:MAG: cysteine hydrolase [Actinomycetota bacterium]|nr:cysteine hydrolase [Actinomycetota bacterium]
MPLIEIADRSDFTERMKHALELDIGRTAAVTIDMQREYLDPTVGQSTVLEEEADRVLGSTKRFLDMCRSAGMPVIHAYVVRRPEEASRGFHSGGIAYLTKAQEIGVSQIPHGRPRSRPDRVAGSPESEVPAHLVSPDDLHVTSKKGLDSFALTDLHFLLSRILEVDTLLLSGINTDTCVYSTAFTAANLGYRPVVIADCVASMRGIDSHRMALELMSRSIAWVLSLEELSAALGASSDQIL